MKNDKSKKPEVFYSFPAIIVNDGRTEVSAL